MPKLILNQVLQLINEDSLDALFDFYFSLHNEKDAAVRDKFATELGKLINEQTNLCLEQLRSFYDSISDDLLQRLHSATDLNQMITDGEITPDIANNYIKLKAAATKWQFHLRHYNLFFKPLQQYLFLGQLIEEVHPYYHKPGTEIPAKIVEYIISKYGTYIPEFMQTNDFLRQIHAQYMLQLPQFNNWKTKPKLSGKDFGFTLENPLNNERWFIKHTGNEAAEYFISLLLNQLGVKYPESTLIQSGRTLYIATKDASRTYNKNGILKQKNFQTFDYSSDPIAKLLLQQAGAWRSKRFDEYSANEQQQIVNYVDNLFGTAKTRVSFARLIICSILFNLSDLGRHLGNMGVVTRPFSENVPKLELIDFQTSFPSSFSGCYLKPKTSLETSILSHTDSFHFIFKMLAAKLTTHDIVQALSDINSPKVRTAQTHTGYFLTQNKETKTDFKTVVKNCVTQFNNTIANGISAEINVNVHEIANVILNTLETLNSLKPANNIDRSNNLTPLQHIITHKS